MNMKDEEERKKKNNGNEVSNELLWVKHTPVLSEDNVWAWASESHSDKWPLIDEPLSLIARNQSTHMLPSQLPHAIRACYFYFATYFQVLINHPFTCLKKISPSSFSTVIYTSSCSVEKFAWKQKRTTCLLSVGYLLSLITPLWSEVWANVWSKTRSSIREQTQLDVNCVMIKGLHDNHVKIREHFTLL